LTKEDLLKIGKVVNEAIDSRVSGIIDKRVPGIVEKQLTPIKKQLQS